MKTHIHVEGEVDEAAANRLDHPDPASAVVSRCSQEPNVGVLFSGSQNRLLLPVYPEKAPSQPYLSCSSQQRQLTTSSMMSRLRLSRSRDLQPYGTRDVTNYRIVRMNGNPLSSSVRLLAGDWFPRPKCLPMWSLFDRAARPAQQTKVTNSNRYLLPFSRRVKFDDTHLSNFGRNAKQKMRGEKQLRFRMLRSELFVRAA